MSEQRAEKACLELAIFLRYLDDEEGLSKYVEARTNFQFGRLIVRGGAAEQLKLPDVANKISCGSSSVGLLRRRPPEACVSVPRDREVGEG